MVTILLIASICFMCFSVYNLGVARGVSKKWKILNNLLKSISHSNKIPRDIKLEIINIFDKVILSKKNLKKTYKKKIPYEKPPVERIK